MIVVSTADESTVGVVIAGGRSVRFHGEKAAALLRREPLIIWAAARLRPSCTAVAANVRRTTEAESIARGAGLPLLYDEPGDALGPLAGIKVALQWAKSMGARTLAVSPCDAPLLPDDLFPRLLAAAEGAASFATTDEGLQPMCAVWPVTSLPVVSAALADGAHPSLWRTLDAVGAHRVHFEDAPAFANVNTRDDLARLAARYQR